MVPDRVYFQGEKGRVRDAIISVIRSATGASSRHLEYARSIHTTVGLAALSDIARDFYRKARGQVGEDGETWPRLSPKYLAYGRRFGTGEQAALKRQAGLGRGHRMAPGGNRGLLTAEQLRRWKQIFASRLRWLASRMPLAQAKKIAAAIAWAKLKEEGAKTKLEVYGNREHTILMDTGSLFASLSPGEEHDADQVNNQYDPPENQIFELMRSGVIVGTNIPHAKVHNRGNRQRGIPKRQFVPVERAPQIWRDRWVAVLQRNMKACFFDLLSSGAT